jgi:hypothetical protein
LTERKPLTLEQPRTLGALFSDTLRVYLRHFPRFLAIGVAVVLPAELIVSGAGIGLLTSGYDPHRPLIAELMPTVVQVLVTSPLIAAICAYALLDLGEERPPGVRSSIQSGLDVFAQLFVPVLVSVGCEILTIAGLVLPLALAVGSALVPTLVIPVALAVRWYFVPQEVVLGGTRRLAALRSSWELTRGSSMRVFGIVVLAYLGLVWTAGLVAAPLFALAKSADSGLLVLAANVVSQSLATPAIAILSTLLYFDLRTRRRA